MKNGYLYVVVGIAIVIVGVFLIFQLQKPIPVDTTAVMKLIVPANQTTPYGCGHDLMGNFAYHYYGACSSDDKPTIPSQAKGIPQDTIRGLVDYDEKLYIEMVHGGCPQGHCGDSVTGFCKYDKNGELIPHLSEDQKKVILDLNSSYGFDICPFTRQPTNFTITNTQPSGTIIGPSGTVNVTVLGQNNP